MQQQQQLKLLQYHHYYFGHHVIVKYVVIMIVRIPIILLLCQISDLVSSWSFTMIKSSFYNNRQFHTVVSNSIQYQGSPQHSSSSSPPSSPPSSLRSTIYNRDIDNKCNIPSSSTSSTTTKVTTLPSLQHYMLERNVTIKSVTWCNMNHINNNNNNNNNNQHYSDSLLQIYKGKSVPSVGINTFHHNRYSDNHAMENNYNNNINVNRYKNDNNKSIKYRIQHFITLLQEYQQGGHNDNYNEIIKKAMNISSIPYTALSVTTIKRIEIYMKTICNNSNNINTYETFTLYMKLYSEIKSTQYTIQTIIQNYIHIVYIDQYICVIHKPSGILSVPGPRRNPNTCTALYHLLHSNDNYTTNDDDNKEEKAAAEVIKNIDQMVVHRLDMDTSGIIIYALNTEALYQLHTDFRQRNVIKQYQALVCGHVHINNTNTNKSKSSRMTILDYEIDVDLERDPYHPPFMRIVQPKQKEQQRQPYEQQLQVNHKGAFFNEAPKPCLTEMHILSYEYITDYNYETNQTIRIPVTRVQLIPRTGRTHQLRVHMAQVIGHPIVGDDIYGYGGDCYITTIHDNSLNNEMNHNDINSNDNNNNMNDIQRQLANFNIPLCLHAHKLHIRHPISNSPMIFECQPNF